MKGAIFTARVDSVVYFRFTGVIRYSQCGGLESFINQLFSKADFTDVAVDLEMAEMLDSTALGLLARISIEYKKISDKKAVIFIHNGELANILKRVCFDRVFNIISKPKSELDMDFVELSSISESDEQTLDCVIEAHKNLASLSSDNAHYFTDITRAVSMG